jgi:copper transport protein
MRGRACSAEGRSPARPDFLGLAFHLLEFLGLLLAIGSLVVRRLATLRPPLDWARLAVPIPLAGAVAGAIGLLVAGPPRSALIGSIHLVSAGIWGGGILAMTLLRPPGGWRGGEGVALIERFARVAVIAFLVTVLTGVIQATDRLQNLTDLWTTTYGLVLSCKCASVAVMGALSLAWRRGLPVVRLDAAAAILVVVLTALLAALPVAA